jgi:hypothetical protein
MVTSMDKFVEGQNIKHLTDEMVKQASRSQPNKS